MTQVDARGCACPEPVVMTRNALMSDPEGATIMVDNICAVENITRFAAHQGYAVDRKEQGEEWTLTLTKS